MNDYDRNIYISDGFNYCYINLAVSNMDDVRYGIDSRLTTMTEKYTGILLVTVLSTVTSIGILSVSNMDDIRYGIYLR